MFTLALDVDGVLLDPDRGGAGHWTNELTARFGITRDEFRRAFFMTAWDDVVNGRRPIEPAVAAALEVIGSTATVEDVLGCWFEADYVPIEAAVGFARRAAASGTRVVLGDESGAPPRPFPHGASQRSGHARRHRVFS